MAKCEGCTWNNDLAKKDFVDQMESHGVEYAKSYLRENIRHWTAKRNGREIPSWTAILDDQNHLKVGDQTLIDTTEGPINGKNKDCVSEEIKALVPIEVETIRQAERLASMGAKIIYMPEHSPTGVRFMTIYRQDSENPRKYIGTQQDLGVNLTFDQAKKRMQSIIRDSSLTLNQSDQKKDAFVFGLKRPPEPGVYELRHPSPEPVQFFELQKSPTTHYRLDVHQMVGWEHKIIRHAPVQSQQDKREIVPRITENQQKKEHVMLDKIREKPLNIAKVIERLYTERRQMVSALALVSETLVAVEKSIVRHKKKEMKHMQKIENMQCAERKQLRKKRREVVKNLIMQEGVVHVQQRNQEKRIVVKKKEFIQLVRMQKKEARIRIKKKEVLRRRLFEGRPRHMERSNRTMRKEHKKQRDRFVHMLVVIASKIHKTERQTKPIFEKVHPKMVQEKGLHIENVRRTDMPETKQKSKIIDKKIQRFSFACLLFVLLHTFNSEKNYSELNKETSDTSELLGQKEPTPWVLLSIISYLAMIREQGMIRHTSKKKKKRQSGIIFERNMSMPRVIHGMIWI